MEIEEIAQQSPETILREVIEPAVGMQAFQAREIAFGLGIHDRLRSTGCRDDAPGLPTAPSATSTPPWWRSIRWSSPRTARCWRSMQDDASTTTPSSAGPNVSELRDYAEEDPREAQAAEYGLNYVALDGEIGCIINGAGLAMATMDMIKHAGGSPANFLDVGGGASPERVARRLPAGAADPKIDAMLVNIFAGINRCDWVAQGVVQAVRESWGHRSRWWSGWPGTNVEEGRAILMESGTEPDHHGRYPGGGRGEGGRRPPRVTDRKGTAGNGHMSILIDGTTRSSSRASPATRRRSTRRRSIEYGTKIVGGVTPGKGGARRTSRPPGVQHREGCGPGRRGPRTQHHLRARGVLRRFDHGGGRRRHPPGLVTITDGIPAQDMMMVKRYLLPLSQGAAHHPDRSELRRRSSAPARRCSASCPGTSTCRGQVGLVTRSGTLGYEAAVADEGARHRREHERRASAATRSTAARFVDMLKLFEEDPETDAVMMIGEIGGPQEAEAALCVKENMTKPVIGYVAGLTAPKGRRMGHAGAIISAFGDTAAEKAEIMRSAGMAVAPSPADLGTPCAAALAWKPAGAKVVPAVSREARRRRHPATAGAGRRGADPRSSTRCSTPMMCRSPWPTACRRRSAHRRRAAPHRHRQGHGRGAGRRAAAGEDAWPTSASDSTISTSGGQGPWIDGDQHAGCADRRYRRHRDDAAPDGRPARRRRGAAICAGGSGPAGAPPTCSGANVTGKTLGLIGMGRIARAVAQRAHSRLRDEGHLPRSVPPPAGGGEGARRGTPGQLEAGAGGGGFRFAALPGDTGDPAPDQRATRLGQMQRHACSSIPRAATWWTRRRWSRRLQGEEDRGRRPRRVREGADRSPDALLAMENVVLLPHLGSATRETRVAMGMRALENLTAVLRRRAAARPGRVTTSGSWTLLGTESPNRPTRPPPARPSTPPRWPSCSSGCCSIWCGSGSREIEPVLRVGSCDPTELDPSCWRGSAPACPGHLVPAPLHGGAERRPCDAGGRSRRSAATNRCAARSRRCSPVPRPRSWRIRPGRIRAAAPAAGPPGHHRPSHRSQAGHGAGKASADLPQAGRPRVAALDSAGTEPDPRRAAERDRAAVDDRRAAAGEADGAPGSVLGAALLQRDPVRGRASEMLEKLERVLATATTPARPGGPSLLPVRLVDRRRPRRESLRHQRRHPEHTAGEPDRPPVPVPAADRRAAPRAQHHRAAPSISRPGSDGPLIACWPRPATGRRSRPGIPARCSASTSPAWSSAWRHDRRDGAGRPRRRRRLRLRRRAARRPAGCWSSELDDGASATIARSVIRPVRREVESSGSARSGWTSGRTPPS